MPEPSILDARLAEIDRRLRTIQSGLEPPSDPGDGPRAGEPAAASPTDEPAAASPADEPAAVPPGAADAAARRAVEERLGASAGPDEAIALTAQLRELSEAHERMLDLHRELLAEYADAVSRSSRAASEASEASESRRRDGEATETIAVMAGPFTGAQAVRDFARALQGLPLVADVAVREYVGGDRVLIDVQVAVSTA